MHATRALGRAFAGFFSGTMLSRISGMIRDMVMAAAFGASPLFSAFLVAYRFANLPRRLFGEGAMHAAFIPQYEAIRKVDPERARHFFRDLVYLLTLLLGVSGCAVAYFLPSHTAVLRLTRFLLPFLPFICLYGLKLAYHNCQGAYFRPSMAPVLFNLVWMGGALLASPTERGMGLLALVVGGGFVVQWLMVALPLARELGPKGLHLFTPELRRCLRSLGLALLGVGAVQINSALDPLFAFAGSPSAPAHLWYAIRLQQFPLALFGLALSSVVLPPLSRARDEEEYGRVYSWGRERAFELMAPCTIGILVCGLAAVSLLFHRGAFGAGDCRQTTLCLIGYGVGLVPMALILLRTAALHSRGDYRTPATLSAVSVVLNILLNTLFVFVLHWGGVGVALSTSLCAFFQAALLKTKVGEGGWGGGMAWLASAASGMAALLMDRWVGGAFFWERSLAAGLLGQLVALGIPAATFLLVYGVLMGRRLLALIR
ncbi:MAG: murein biosynthesis integral membrane protein MurJ [Parachlamydiales bacterium]